MTLVAEGAKILKLTDHDEKAEMQFESAFVKGLTVNQRFEMVEKHSRRLLEIMIRRGHRKPFEILKRT